MVLPREVNPTATAPPPSDAAAVTFESKQAGRLLIRDVVASHWRVILVINLLYLRLLT